MAEGGDDAAGAGVEQYEPEILLLDEPLSALDAHLKVRMQSVLADLQRQLGITFVYVTRSQSEAFSMADRVVIMSRGRIEQIAARDLQHAAHASCGRVGTSVGRLRLGAAPQGFASGNQVVVTVPGDRIELAAAPPSGEDNVLEATVMGEEFIGATATVCLETADGTGLRAQKSHTELERISIRTGKKLFVAWRPDHAHVLPPA